jgi:hypothetical protein
MPAETLWRLATGGMSLKGAARATQIKGNRNLAEPVLSIVSVVR